MNRLYYSKVGGRWKARSRQTGRGQRMYASVTYRRIMRWLLK
jgi:hypothetical protein